MTIKISHYEGRIEITRVPIDQLTAQTISLSIYEVVELVNYLKVILPVAEQWHSEYLKSRLFEAQYDVRLAENRVKQYEQKIEDDKRQIIGRK
jgi:hypothetical protein